MDTIIQQFQEKITKDIKKEIENIFLEGISDISQLIETIDVNLKELGRKIIKYILEESDKIIKDLPERKKHWQVQAKGKKTLITEFGEITYERTYYKSKGKKGYSYLVDEQFGIEKYQRIDKGLTAKIIDLSGEYSYEKSAKLAVKTVKLSRQTVKNKLREIGEIDNIKPDGKGKKKRVSRLYVEADEEHISLQNGKNTMVKLVYVHEGKEIKDGRMQLRNPHYFSGLYKNPEELWLKVIDYIDARYELDKIEAIYLAGDGAFWIREGLNWLLCCRYVLDKYHLNKYVLQATGHMPGKRLELWYALNRCDYKGVKEAFQEIIKVTEKGSKREAVKEAYRYIIGNWDGIEIYSKDPHVLGCSAEGHVSHVLSDRMSSRPMGWSREGADQMARLRAFKYNGGGRKELYRILERKKKAERLEIKREKFKDLIKKSSLYSEAKEVIPILRRGKVDSTFNALKSLAF